MTFETVMTFIVLPIVCIACTVLGYYTADLKQKKGAQREAD